MRSVGPTVCALLIIVLGAWLRYHGAEYNFDHDEVFSVEIARQNFETAFQQSLADRPHPPFHALLLWAWVHVVGPSETAVRLSSVVMSLAFLGLLWRTAIRLMGAWLALLPLFLCAVSPFFVFYGEQARPFALAQVFATLTLYCLVRALEERSLGWRWPIIYGSSCLGLMLTQYMGVLLVVGQLFAVCLLSRAQRMKFVVSGLVGCLGIVPWAVAASLQRNPDAVEWVPSWMGPPGLTALFELYADFFGTFYTAGTTRILLAITVVVAICALYRWRALLDWRVALLATSVAIPLFGTFFASRLGPASIWAPRHLIGPGVALMCLVGVLLRRTPARIVLPVSVAFCAWSLLASPHSDPSISKPPYRALAIELSQAGGVLVGIEEWVVRPLQYYSPTLVHYLGDPATDGTSPLILVCRTANCDARTVLEPEYEAFLLRYVTWTPRPDPSSTLEIYWLEKRGGEGSPGRE